MRQAFNSGFRGIKQMRDFLFWLNRMLLKLLKCFWKHFHKLTTNSPFHGCLVPLCQGEGWCTTIDKKLSLIWMWITSNFHMRGWASYETRFEKEAKRNIAVRMTFAALWGTVRAECFVFSINTNKRISDYASNPELLDSEDSALIAVEDTRAWKTDLLSK